MSIKPEILMELKERTQKFEIPPQKEFLRTSFDNPLFTEHFIKSTAIDPNFVFFPAKKDAEINFMSIRNQQNKEWAYEQTVQGINFARQNDLETAIKRYDTALEMDPECVEAYVARGAAMANQRNTKEAIKDLKTAVKIDPEHRNAQKYLDKLLQHERKVKEEHQQFTRGLLNGEFILPENYDSNYLASIVSGKQSKRKRDSRVSKR